MPPPTRTIAVTVRARVTRGAAPSSADRPNCGRSITKAATASSTTMITGRSTSLLIPAAKNAPVIDPTSAARPIRSAVPTFTGALRA